MTEASESCNLLGTKLVLDGFEPQSNGCSPLSIRLIEDLQRLWELQSIRMADGCLYIKRQICKWKEKKKHIYVKWNNDTFISIVYRWICIFLPTPSFSFPRALELHWCGRPLATSLLTPVLPPSPTSLSLSLRAAAFWLQRYLENTLPIGSNIFNEPRSQVLWPRENQERNSQWRLKCCQGLN